MDKLINYYQGQNIINLAQDINYALHANFSGYASCINSTVTPGVVGNNKSFLDNQGQLKFGNMSLVSMEDCVLSEGEKLVIYDKYLTAPFNVTGNASGSSDIFHINSSMGRPFLNEFNYPVTITNNVTNCDYMFQGCRNFNQPVTIPNSVISCRRMFYGAHVLNCPVVIPNSVAYCGDMFVGCYNFSSTITPQEGISSIDYLLSDTNDYGQFNANLIIPSSVRSMNGTFKNAKYNRPIILPTGVQYIDNMCAYFQGKYDISIPDNVISMNHAFLNYNGYNTETHKNITVGNNVRYMVNAFYQCNCGSLTIGNDIYSMYRAAYRSNIFSTLRIGSNISSAQYAFLESVIYSDIAVNGITNAQYMFYNSILASTNNISLQNINNGSNMWVNFTKSGDSKIKNITILNCNNLFNAFYRRYGSYTNLNLYMDEVYSASNLFCGSQRFYDSILNMNSVIDMGKMFEDASFVNCEIYIGPNGVNTYNMFRYAYCDNTVIRMPSGKSTYGWSSEANNSVVRY